MCGGCGSRSLPSPWEAQVDGGTRRDLIRRAAEAQTLSDGRLQVRAFGEFGYQSLNRTGSRAIQADLDSLVTLLLSECGPKVLGRARDASSGAVAQALLRRAGTTTEPVTIDESKWHRHTHDVAVADQQGNVMPPMSSSLPNRSATPRRFGLSQFRPQP